MNKNRDSRPSAVEALKSLWFVEFTPFHMELSLDPNLSSTILNIGRSCVKSKRIKKQKELMEMLSPSKRYPKFRLQFLSIHDYDSTHSEGADGRLS